MAFNDYQYIGYTDEKIVTYLILTNLSRVMKARRDRELWLDSMALQLSSATDTAHVKGGDGKTKIERNLEQKDCDKILKALSKIELTILNRIKTLSPKEQTVIQESFINTRRLNTKEIAQKYALTRDGVAAAKRTSLKKLADACVRVYKDFCLWRAYDDKELKKRIKESDETIKQELKKKLGVA